MRCVNLQGTATGKKIFKVNNVCGMLKSDYYVGSCSI